MKGKLVKINGDWAVRFFDSSYSSTIPVHPNDISFVPSLNEGAEIEFDIHDEETPIQGRDRFARILIQHNF